VPESGGNHCSFSGGADSSLGDYPSTRVSYSAHAVVQWRGPLGVHDAYSGCPRLFRKLNNFSQQINKLFLIKKAKSEIEDFKTLCKSEGI
jgi:hypothetical protein